MRGRGRLLREHPFPEPEPVASGVSALLELDPEDEPERSRPRTSTLRGVPLPLPLRPPSRPPPLEEVKGTDPDEEITKVRLVKPRAKCTSCGYLAHHVHTFPDGLCGLCRTTVG